MPTSGTIENKTKERWFWTNNLFWWTMGFLAGLIIMTFLLNNK